MKRAILLLAASLACLARSGAAQLPPDNTTAPVAVSDPTKLFQRLMPPRLRDEDCESTAKEQAAVLRELGIPATSAQEARLVFEDLDGDGVPEALFTVDIDLANVVLVVLKRKGNQWYRLPSPPGFSCWCKYENSSLVDTFVEIQHWSYDFEKPRQPRRLVFVRGSSGGTGLYERDLQVFALRGFELREVFGRREDRRECGPEGKCDFQHITTTVEDENGLRRALVTREFRPPVGADDRDMLDHGWWHGLPVSACAAYIWSPNQFSFVKTDATTAGYCGIPARPKPATKKH